MQDTPILPVSEIDRLLSDIPIARIQQGHKYFKDANGKRILYLDVISSFDIETSYKDFSSTNLEDYEAWMYIWQFQLGDLATFIGRTWEEFFALVTLINQHLEKRKARLLCYVHELSHEFQFLAGIWDFKEEDVMAIKERVPIKALMGFIELRCSRRLADLSLRNWCRELKTDHQKTELDYSVTRYPWSDLSEEELRYCINDVVCVVECVMEMMRLYGDSVYTIPYTSTGYIRRKVKTSLRYWSYRGIRSLQNSFQHYKYLREAARGGDSYEALQYHGTILDDVDIYDISSSYPAITVHCLLPMSQFRDEKPTMEAMQDCINAKRCFVARVAFNNLRLKDQYAQFPYIPYSKGNWGYMTPPRDCDIDPDTERVYAAGYFEMALTDVDLEIIDELYEWEGDLDIKWLISARYGYVPQPLADIIINLFKKKTLLKGTERTAEYNHVKRQLNAGCYGLMAQKMTFPKILFRDGRWIKDPDYNEEMDYADNVEKAFVNYAWSVFITAIGRKRFLMGCLAAQAADPDAFVYGDTDSVVSRVPLDFSEYNRKRIREAKFSGAVAEDKNGETQYIGVFEHQGTGLFRTVGVKQYVTRINGKTEISVSGVPKEKGSKIIESSGGVEAFDDGFIFRDSGKKALYYNDDVDDWVEIDGHQLHLIRNVAIVDASYTLTRGIEYEQLMEFLSKIDDIE